MLNLVGKLITQKHTNKVRNNPVHRYPRCHYNFKGKAKMAFDSEEEARKYIKAKHLKGYTVYICRVCNKYHISHRNKKGESA